MEDSIPPLEPVPNLIREGTEWSEGKMHHKASPEIFRRAKELREKMTPAEQVLWEKLRANRLNGIHFRRQHPISKYIVDFYCHEHLLALEIDGEIHHSKDQRMGDKGREEDLQQLSLNILRFSNDEVLNEIQTVLNRILSEIERIRNGKGYR